MSRKFIATILAASIAVTSLSARPAAALTDEQLGALLFGGLPLPSLARPLQSAARNPKLSPRRAGTIAITPIHRATVMCSRRATGRIASYCPRTV